jgi:hypothetical protein
VSARAGGAGLPRQTASEDDALPDNVVDDADTLVEGR